MAPLRAVLASGVEVQLEPDSHTVTTCVDGCENGGTQEFGFECVCQCIPPWKGDTCAVADASVQTYIASADAEKQKSSVNNEAARNEVVDEQDVAIDDSDDAWLDTDSELAGLNSFHDDGEVHLAKLGTLDQGMNAIMANVDSEGNHIWDQSQVESSCETMVEDCDCGAQIQNGDMIVGRSLGASKTVRVSFTPKLSYDFSSTRWQDDEDYGLTTHGLFELKSGLSVQACEESCDSAVWCTGFNYVVQTDGDSKWGVAGNCRMIEHLIASGTIDEKVQGYRKSTTRVETRDDLAGRYCYGGDRVFFYEGSQTKTLQECKALCRGSPTCKYATHLTLIGKCMGCKALSPTALWSDATTYEVHRPRRPAFYATQLGNMCHGGNAAHPYVNGGAAANTQAACQALCEAHSGCR